MCEVEVVVDLTEEDGDYKDGDYIEVDEENKSQKTCCIENCENKIQNRSLKSLKMSYTFKGNYKLNKWDKICHYHYFSDLYAYKKKIHGCINKPLKRKYNKNKTKINEEDILLFQNFLDQFK